MVFLRTVKFFSTHTLKPLFFFIIPPFIIYTHIPAALVLLVVTVITKGLKADKGRKLFKDKFSLRPQLVQLSYFKLHVFFFFVLKRCYFLFFHYFDVVSLED